MPKSVDWNKQVAMELIKAGFFSLAKKNHPDHGGSHEKMLTLTATKEYLEGVLNGSQSYNYQQQREEPPKKPKRPQQEWPRRPSGEDSPRPQNMIRYAFGWWVIDDVEVIRTSDKAILVSVPKEDEPLWFPKSQLHKNANEVWEYEDVGAIVFSEWIARQKGWV